MIKNANKNKIGSKSRLPNMSQTIMGWFLPIEFGIVTRQIVDYEPVDTITRIKTQGVVQPPKPEDIELQVEGVRNWEWQEIHCLPNLQVDVNQFIFYLDKKYKVMKKENFSQYGYMRYLVCEAYDE